MRNRELLPNARPVYEQDRVSFQSRVKIWLEQCFGLKAKFYRTHRFIEEALELGQACGCSKEEALKLVEYVYNRPVGEPIQEVGGVMITLAGLCNAQELDMDEAADKELSRVWTKIEEIRKKQAGKPTGSPLPQ